MINLLATVALAALLGAGTYSPSQDTDAVDQPESPRVVGHLRAGQSYPLEKRGGPGQHWCKVALGAADGWVECAAAQTTAAGAQTTAAAAQPTAPAADAPPADSNAPFDYYVLTLSWSPAFCETPAGSHSPEQCDGRRHYAFVVHGLWPQNEHGYPEHCPTSSAGPSQATVSAMLDRMPSRQLIAHEWQEHGTCSGLSAEQYFARIRNAADSIRIPAAYQKPQAPFGSDAAQLVSDFRAANPQLGADSIAVRCSKELQEVRICLDRSLAPRRCGADVHSTCRGSFRVPPVR